MGKYIIREIHAEGYERFAVVEEIASGGIFTVYFLEYDEYAEQDSQIQKRKKGEVLEGNFTIDLVCVHRKVQQQLRHHQPIQTSPNIETVVEVSQVIDKYTLLVVSSVSKDKILIEFEQKMDYQIGDKIYIEGFLNLEIKQ